MHAQIIARRRSLDDGAQAYTFLRESEELRRHGIRDPRLDRLLEQERRRCAIGTPVACAPQTDFPSGTSRQSNALTTSAADLVVGFARWESGTPTVTFTDLSGASWNTLPTVGNGGICCMGYAVTAAGQPDNRVTVTFGTSVDAIQVAFCRVTGIDATPLDDNVESTAATMDAGDLITTVADAILFLFGTAFGAASASNWFGQGGSVGELIDTNDVFMVGYRIVSSTGTYAAEATPAGDGNRTAVAAAFKGGAAAAAASLLPRGGVHHVHLKS